MESKIVNLFRRFFTGCQKSIRKFIDFVTRKKRPKTLENHYQDPIYLLFPNNDNTDENGISFNGPDSTGSPEEKNVMDNRSRK